MASRTGTRPVGTDGSDFRNREKIANHYNIGPFLKKRLRFVYFCHIMAWLVLVIKFLPEVFRKLDIQLAVLDKVTIPLPENWEFVWFLGSLTPSMFGYLSLARNRVFLLKLSLIGTIFFGCIPIFIGVCLKAMELYEFYQTKVSHNNIFGLPIVVLWYIFFCVAIQIHGFAIYFGYKLLYSWTTVCHKKKI